MLAAEEVPGQVVIQVVDASGVPVASHAGIDFTIAGAAGALPTVGRILAGQSFVTLPIEGRRERKSLQVWVASPTLGAAAVDVLTETLPLELTVRYEGGHLFPDDEAEVVVTAISAGLPVAGVELDWAPANGTLVDPPSVTDANGQARATFVATQPGEGIVIVSASRAGYTSIGSQAPIPVVDPVARQGPSSATFLGIPVIILFGLALVALVAYTASVALPALRVPGAERLRAQPTSR